MSFSKGYLTTRNVLQRMRLVFAVSVLFALGRSVGTIFFLPGQNDTTAPRMGCPTLPLSETDENAFVAFSHTGAFEDWQLLSLTFAHYFNPGACVVVVTDDHDTLSTHPLVKKLNIWVVPSPQADEKMGKLAANYKHSSSNGPEFELSCFARFGYLDLVFSSFPKNLRLSIAHLDLDLVPFSSYPPALGGAYLWTLHRHATYYVRFSREALHDFATFIHEMYEQTPRDFAHYIQKYGSGIASEETLSRVKQKESVRAWFPSETGLEPRQFSDMYAYRAWLETVDKSTITTHLAETNFAKLAPSHMALIHLRRALNDSKACDRDSTRLSQISWRDIVIETTEGLQAMKVPLLPGGNSTAEPALGLHFQGKDCKLRMCSVLCPMVLAVHKSEIRCCLP